MRISEDLGLFCVGGFNLFFGLGDGVVIFFWRSKFVFFFDLGKGFNLFCFRKDLEFIVGYGEELDWDLFCLGDMVDFSLGFDNNLFLFCFVGDLGVSLAIGDEDSDWLFLGDVWDLFCRDGDVEWFCFIFGFEVLDLGFGEVWDCFFCCRNEESK